MEKTTLGKFISDTRRGLGMTQQALADRLHVTDKAVSKWERGLSYPDLTLLDGLAAALELTTTELIACRREPSPEPIDNVGPLLDIAKDSSRRLNKRFYVVLTLLVAVVTLALSASLIYLFRTESTTTQTVFWGKRATDQGRFVLIEQDGRLLTLSCSDPQLYDSILADDSSVYRATYRWSPVTYRGELTGCEAAPDAAESFPITDIAGSAIGVDELFGIDCMILEYRSIYPDPNREKDYLFTLCFYYCGDGKDYYLGQDVLKTTVLTVKDCRDLAQGDFDADGIAELFVVTQYDEAPYVVYDLVDGQIISEFVEEIPSLAAQQLFFSDIRSHP